MAEIQIIGPTAISVSLFEQTAQLTEILNSAKIIPDPGYTVVYASLTIVATLAAMGSEVGEPWNLGDRVKFRATMAEAQAFKDKDYIIVDKSKVISVTPGTPLD